MGLFNAWTGLLKGAFGSKDKGAQKRTSALVKEGRQYVVDQAAGGRIDLLDMWPRAEANRNMGYQSALDVFGQTMPQALSTFQQGNVGAQGALLAGLPQIQNAIYGLPTDLSGMQPQAIQYDPSYTQQQLPDFFGAQAPPPDAAQQLYEGASMVGDHGNQTGFNYSDLLAGIAGRMGS